MELENSTVPRLGRHRVRHRPSCASGRGCTASRSSLTVEPDVGEIEADELRFKQVVLNLLSNAVKFTPDGGEVRLLAPSCR